MKIKDIFSEIRTGRNIETLTSSNDVTEVYTFKKEALSYSVILENKLEKRIISSEVKDKYIMQPRDIIISLKKPYKVGVLPYQTDKRIFILNNFAILRNINRDLYSYIFVSNYLERIGLEEYVNEHNIKGDITIEDIKNINIPDISKEKQMTISKLMSKINERSNIYNTILENDDFIIKYMLNKVIGEYDDKCN